MGEQNKYLSWLTEEDVTPVLRGEVIAAAVNADTNIFSSDIVAADNGFFIIQVVTDTAGYPKVVLTPAGSGTQIVAGLNESSNLTTNSIYEFWYTTRTGDALNIRFSASATVTCRVFFVKSS